MGNTKQASYVISCTGCGFPFQESENCSSTISCPNCGKVMKVVVKKGRVSFFDNAEISNGYGMLLRKWRLTRCNL